MVRKLNNAQGQRGYHLNVSNCDPIDGLGKNNNFAATFRSGCHVSICEFGWQISMLHWNVAAIAHLTPTLSIHGVLFHSQNGRAQNSCLESVCSISIVWTTQTHVGSSTQSCFFLQKFGVMAGRAEVKTTMGHYFPTSQNWYSMHSICFSASFPGLRLLETCMKKSLLLTNWSWHLWNCFGKDSHQVFGADICSKPLKMVRRLVERTRSVGRSNARLWCPALSGLPTNLKRTWPPRHRRGFLFQQRLLLRSSTFHHCTVHQVDSNWEL